MSYTPPNGLAVNFDLGEDAPYTPPNALAIDFNFADEEIPPETFDPKRSSSFLLFT